MHAVTRRDDVTHQYRPLCLVGMGVRWMLRGAQQHARQRRPGTDPADPEGNVCHELRDSDRVVRGDGIVLGVGQVDDGEVEVLVAIV